MKKIKNRSKNNMRGLSKNNFCVLLGFVLMGNILCCYGKEQAAINIDLNEYPAYFSIEAWEEIGRVNNALSKVGVEKIVAVVDSPISYIDGLEGQNAEILQQQINRDIYKYNHILLNEPYHGTAVMSLAVSKPCKLMCYEAEGFSTKACDKQEMVVVGIAQHTQVVNATAVKSPENIGFFIEDLINGINPLIGLTDEKKREIRNLHKEFPANVVLNFSLEINKKKFLGGEAKRYINSQKAFDNPNDKEWLSKWANKYIDSEMTWRPAVLGYDLIFTSIDAAKQINWQVISEFSKQNKEAPVLIKYGNKFVLYGFKNKKWGRTNISGNDAAKNLKELPFVKNDETVIIKRYDLILFTSIIETMKAGHAPPAGFADEERIEWSELTTQWYAVSSKIDEAAKTYDVALEKWNTDIKSTINNVPDGSVLFVLAAGNDHEELQPGRVGLSKTSDNDSTIRVGAGCEQDHRSLCPWSNFGDKLVDIVSPGEHIPVILSLESSRDMGTYVSGTSYSAPLITGVAALLAQCNPDASAQDIKKAIFENAYESPELKTKIIGGKVLDVRKAINSMCKSDVDLYSEKPIDTGIPGEGDYKDEL
jgi:hypothetical protein